MATKVVLARKPGTENPLEASLAMINALRTDSQNGIAQANAFLNYAKDNPRDIAMTGYQPPQAAQIPGISNAPNTAEAMRPTHLPPASISTTRQVDSMPDPATHKGYTAKMPDGTVYESDGMRWMRRQ